MSPEVAKKIELLEKAVIELVEMGELIINDNNKYIASDSSSFRDGSHTAFCQQAGVCEEYLKSPTVQEAIKLVRQNER
jgi:hypothetical protein